MRFTASFLDEIRGRLPVSTVVGRKVRLKKQGREWRGLSPFSSEKTPSFFVNDAKGRWFDFSAGKNGDIVSFLMESEGLGFTEAVEQLAGEAGLSLPAVTRDDIHREAHRKTTLDALETAAQFFETSLRSPAGERARAYVLGRGIEAQVAQAFRIGFAPHDRFALRDHLAEKGFDRATMIDAGLLIHGDEIEVPYDRFRGRVMFPICNRSGKVIAFGGRALDPTVPAKYLNSPETDLFHKGSGLYNHHLARKPANNTGRVIVVEGYVDVIAMTEAGFPETVAPLGTALTPDQLALLWGMSVEPILCFDGDKAGQKAADRAIDTALPLISHSRMLRFALLPEGRDPDDLLRSNGPEAITAVVARAMTLIDLLWLRERDRSALETPEHREGLLRRLTDRVGVIEDRQLRRAYLYELRGRAFEWFQSLRRAKTPQANSKKGSLRRAFTISESLARSALFMNEVSRFPRRAVVLTALMDFPVLIPSFAEIVAALTFPNAEHIRVRDCLFGLLDREDITCDAVNAAIDTSGCRVDADTVKRQAGLLRLRDESGGTPLDPALALKQALVLEQRLTMLQHQADAAAAYAADPSDKNYAILSDVQDQLSSKEGLNA